MVELVQYENFKGVGKQKKKKQILVCHTSREAEEYLTSLKFRYNSKYDKIPNYLIKRDGEVLQLLSDSSYSNLMYDESINRNAIFIMIENLGWLEKKPLSDVYLNWIGNIYKQEVFEKKWRDNFIWQPYTKEQTEKVAELCVKIANENNIETNLVGHNTKIEGAEKFEGIISRSNFDSMYTDLNPSFDFTTIFKKIKDEQYSPE